MRDAGGRSVLQSLLEWKCPPTSGDMTLPVSSYEELLARVRNLTHETIQLQRELTTPLLSNSSLDHNDNEHVVTTYDINTCDNTRGVACGGWTTPTTHQATLPDEHHRVSSGHRSGHNTAVVPGRAPWQWERACSTDAFPHQNGGVAGNEDYSVATFLARFGVTLDSQGAGVVRLTNNKENVMDEPKEEDDEQKASEPSPVKEDVDGAATPESGQDDDEVHQKMTNSSTQTCSKPGLSALYHGTWPVERTLWHSGPSSIGSRSLNQQDVASVMSFASSVGPAGADIASRRTYSQQQLGAKVEMVYSLLSMLGTHDRDDMSKTLLAMSSSPDSCIAMRQSGCLPLLVQLLHAPDQDPETRQRAAQALHNVVHSHPDDKRGRREARVLRLLEQVRDYCDTLRAGMAAAARSSPDSVRPILHDDMEKHPGPTAAALMKLSFDEEHRHAMCQLGGLHAVAELIQVDHEAHGSTTADQYCVTLRRYAGMTLTNLTFGDGTNKALLCSFRQFMRALVAQLNSPSEDLRQVTASVLRNLSWRADSASKQTLREVGAVSGLMRAAMEGKKESTLKSILSALWNLSAHCSMNKVDICAVDGALGFLVEMLSYKAPSKTLAIIENAGGILRNISSHIAVREDYRAILRDHNCLQVLLQQLKSPSLTVVSNACGTLWNLSARCAEDQRSLWDMGAVSMLRSLVHSKHKMISMGSSAALKNLLSARPDNNFPPLDSTVKGMGLPALPSLYVRKQRALAEELDQTLAETCDNIEPSTSPSASASGSFTERHSHSTERRHSRLFHGKYRRGPVSRSDSRDSVTSTLSDSVYERVSRTVVNVYGYGQVSPTNEVPQPLSISEDTVTLHSSLSDSGRVHSHIPTNENLSSERRFLRRYCNTMRERQERRKVVSMELSCEDNERHSLPQPAAEHESYQHSHLGQIDEAYSVTDRGDMPESGRNSIPLPDPESQVSDAKPLDDEDGDDIRLSSNVQLDVMSLRPASPTKPAKSLLYDSVRPSTQRSAFSPLVSSPYSTTNNRAQFHQSRGSSSYTSIRNKYSDLGYEDAESQDQPVDYSLKYVEHPVSTHGSNLEGAKGVIGTESLKSEQYERVGRAEYIGTESPYSGSPRNKQNQNDLGRGYGFKNQVSSSVSATNKNMKMNVVYGDYAETDLDQPTDYSLKYPEEEDMEFQKNGSMGRQEGGYYETSDPIHEDTLKTYCTEGTPYETPYNFSTATSMSDLHCEPPTPHSEEAKEEEECHEKDAVGNYDKTGSSEKNVMKTEENKGVKEEDESNFDNSCLEKEPQIKSLPPVPHQPVKGLQSGLSSGLMSPEKPVQYCEEGTPGCFSRVSSLSSLHSLPVVHADGGTVADNQVASEGAQTTRQTLTSPTEEHSGSAQAPDKQCNKEEQAAAAITDDLKEEPRADREGKVVTFGGADHYTEETPLMFSRCSSLGSLSSFEQHSIHDDRSSVISDFSRRTSGVVSPSELPDSPTQTVPPSPRRTKPPVEFTSELPEDAGAVRTRPLPAARHQVAGRPNIPKASVFEDDVAAFKEEDTPIEFSRATSLSSLTIDDEPKISNDAILKEVVPKPTRTTSHRATELLGPARADRDHEEGMEKQDVEKEKRELADCCELATVSEGEEENEDDMLAACISIGMQNSRQRQSQQNAITSKGNPLRSQPSSRHYSPQQPTIPQQSIPSRIGRPSGIPVKTLRTRQDTARTSNKSMNYVEVPGGACEDAVRTYCTEGTPANISHAGSHSDLSVLSLPCDGDETEARSEACRVNQARDQENQNKTNKIQPERDTERPELSDDSSNFSGDNDNILAECIQSGMPKARSQPNRRILPQSSGISVPHTEQGQVKKAMMPATSTATHPSRRPVASHVPKSHHLCGLDHGTRPVPLKKPHNKAGNQQQGQLPEEHKSPMLLPQCLAACDELETYATEGSPNTFSTRSSLSDLTINSAEPGTVASCLRRPMRSRPLSEGTSCDTPLRFATEDTPLEVSHAASLSSLSVGEDEEDEFNAVMEDARPASGASGVNSPLPPHGSMLNSSERVSVSPLNKVLDGEGADSPMHLMMASDGSWGDRSERHEDSLRLQKNSSTSEDVVTVLSRNGSLSSLSVDSFGSTEPTPSEQALLEQCISSGMPKSKSEIGSAKGSRIAVPVGSKKKVVGGCKIPLSSLLNTEHRRPLDSERQTLGIPFLPIQKLELKPLGKPSCTGHDIAVGGLERDMADLTLEDGVCYNTEHIPKNGVDSSAAAAMMVAAADVGEDIAVTAREKDLQNQFENLEEEMIEQMTEKDCHNVSATSSVREIPIIEHPCIESSSTMEMQDTGDTEMLVVKTITSQDGRRVLEIDMKEEPRTNKVKTSSTLYDSAALGVKELRHLQHEMYLGNGGSTVQKLSARDDILSPQGSSTDDKSPLSSGESPSLDFATDSKELIKNKEETDAMIASLDRLTEELVNQAEYMQQKERNGDSGLMKQSMVSNDTWNEDGSPNDVSFPSMSISAPLVASFKSDNREDPAALPDLVEEEDTSSGQREGSMTDSHIIELEAGRVAVAVRAEAAGLEDMEHSITSLNSMDLDAIKPPSMMGSLVSLTTSLSGQLDNADSGEGHERCNSTSLPPPQQRLNGGRVECRHSRKKSLPVGMMVRRALGNNHNGSIENLLDNASASSSCNSHLDNIKPPSAMEEVIDVVDMENSMISVASITSEVADSSAKDHTNSDQSPANSDAIFELLKPAASVMAEVYAAHYASTTMSASVKTSSASDCLDNINPPSAFNEVGDFTDQESAMEPGTETICSDTEMCTEDPAHTYTVDSPDGSRKATPVPSDQYVTSSAESTPKKNQLKPKQLTPKQKRQLVKDRYKTYTITAEEEKIAKAVERKCEDHMEQTLEMRVSEETPAEAASDVANKPAEEQENEIVVKSPNTTKLTPKQRRQEDRSRFQTQVLDKPLATESNFSEQAELEAVNNYTNLEPKENQQIDDSITEIKMTSDQKSGIPSFRKTGGVKTVKQKRAEARDRFRTRTLSEDNCLTQKSEFLGQTCEGATYARPNKSGLDYVEALFNITPEEFETLLEHDANIVINTLNETRGNSESSEIQSSDDMLLDCETLSLVSVDSESDHNLNPAARRSSLDVKKCYGNVETTEHMVEEPEVFEEEIVESQETEQVSTNIEENESEEESESSGDECYKGVKGPRIIKPNLEDTGQSGSMESVNGEEAGGPGNSPKAIRGRRKALYSSPGARKPLPKPSSLPKVSRTQSNIPVVGKNSSQTNSSVRPTRASALRQTGRGGSTTPSPRSMSRTPSSGGASPANVSPKSTKGTKGIQRSSGLKTPSPSSKASTPRSSIGSNTSIRTPNNTPNTSFTPNASDKNMDNFVDSEEQQCKDPKFRPPERQGTFTKDEPSTVAIAKTSVPASPTKTRIPIPSSMLPAGEKEGKQAPDVKKKRISKALPPATAAKVKSRKEVAQHGATTRASGNQKVTRSANQDNSRVNKGNIAQKTVQKAATIPGRTSSARAHMSTAGKLANRRSIAGGEIKTSLSNQSLQSNDSSKGTSKNSMTPNQRSSSNCSLSSVTSGGTITVKKSITKKEVTSKIAGLWKRVEESKNKQKFQKKDTRVWITATTNGKTEAQNESGSMEEASIQPTQRLVRSSTFEGLPSKQDTKEDSGAPKPSQGKLGSRISKFTNKHGSKSNRNSGDFTGFGNNVETAPKIPTAEMLGVMVVQPLNRAPDGTEIWVRREDRVDAATIEKTATEVVLRRKRNNTKSTASEDSKDSSSDNPKRLSRLGSFIRIDSSESNSGDGKSQIRPPASAIVPPFNYNPPPRSGPAVGSHIPTPIKRSESYMSSVGDERQHGEANDVEERLQEFSTASMRVTTV